LADHLLDRDRAARAREALRGPDRRTEWEPMAENAMRCDACGTVWFSAVAALTVSWATCVQCGGPLHVERRSASERRRGRFERRR
jgi:hypothetical protein